jgi:ferrous iron transport protein A
MGYLTFSDFESGQSGRLIRYLPGDAAYRQLLLSIGLTPGTVFQFVRRAPFRGPIEIIVRGVHLSLRAHEAAMLGLERLSASFDA